MLKLKFQKNEIGDSKSLSVGPYYRSILYSPCTFPMDTSSSIRHRFDVEIPRGKFVEITSILKDKSTWKL